MKEVATKRFANGWVSVLNTEDNHPIEVTSTCLPLGTELRGTVNKGDNTIDSITKSAYTFWDEKFMVGISTQSGCPVHCKFCATNKVTQKHGWRNLTGEEMLEQVKYAVEKTGKNPADAQLFRVLFTRMGEPSLNLDGVFKGMRLIKREYPNARIQISTIGMKDTRDLIMGLLIIEEEFGNDWIELQFSIHSTDDKYRKWLQNPSVLSNEDIGKLAEYYYYAKPRKWKVTLNFALSKETPFDTEDLLHQFDKDACFIKISPINENVVSDENNLHTLFNYRNAV